MHYLTCKRNLNEKEVANMSIVFILLGAVGATLFAVSKLGLDVPPQEHAHLDLIQGTQRQSSREELSIAA